MDTHTEEKRMMNYHPALCLAPQHLLHAPHEAAVQTDYAKYTHGTRSAKMTHVRKYRSACREEESERQSRCEVAGMDESIDGVVQQHIRTHLLPFHRVEYDEHGGDEKDGSENCETVGQTTSELAKGRVLEMTMSSRSNRSINRANPVSCACRAAVSPKSDCDDGAPFVVTNLVLLFVDENLPRLHAVVLVLDADEAVREDERAEQQNWQEHGDDLTAHPMEAPVRQLRRADVVLVFGHLSGNTRAAEWRRHDSAKVDELSAETHCMRT